MRRILLRTLCVASLCVVLSACGGGGGGDGATGVDAASIVVGDPTAATSAAKLVYRTRMRMNSAVLASVTADEKATLQQEGVLIQSDSLIFPDTPVAGEWVEIGGRRYMTAKDGTVQVDSAAVTGPTARVFRQLTDANAFGTFSVAGAFVPSGQTPPVTVINETLTQVGPMNDEQDPASKAESRLNCDLRNVSACAGNSAPCCVDYNNPKGDGKPYYRSKVNEDVVPVPTPCGIAAINNFWDSTCYNWSFGKDGKEAACWNEKAFLLVPFAPSCWSNHKYRNCQNMDPNGFTAEAQDSTTVQPEQTVHIRVFNNTKENESGVVVRPDDSNVKGKLSGEGLEGEVLRHYDDKEKQHHEERIITFTAPKLPAGKSQIVNTISVKSDGHTQDIEITIADKSAITYKGKIHYQSVGGHHFVGWKDTPNFTVSVDMNVTLRGNVDSTGGGARTGPDSTYSWQGSGFQDFGGGHTESLGGSGTKAFADPNDVHIALDRRLGTALISFYVHAGSVLTLTEDGHTTAELLAADSSETGGPVKATLLPDLTIKGGSFTYTVHTTNQTGDYNVTLSWPDMPAGKP